ncbi:hypothetical protein ASG20_06885 [Sphingomonas sp. Leaf198]|nr:hypothetical protein ASG20_06885 [Sphingomonas sp. Leaf198]
MNLHERHAPTEYEQLIIDGQLLFLSEVRFNQQPRRYACIGPLIKPTTIAHATPMACLRTRCIPFSLRPDKCHMTAAVPRLDNQRQRRWRVGRQHGALPQRRDNPFRTQSRSNNRFDRDLVDQSRQPLVSIAEFAMLHPFGESLRRPQI